MVERGVDAHITSKIISFRIAPLSWYRFELICVISWSARRGLWSPEWSRSRPSETPKDDGDATVPEFQITNRFGVDNGAIQREKESESLEAKL